MALIAWRALPPLRARLLFSPPLLLPAPGWRGAASSSLTFFLCAPLLHCFAFCLTSQQAAIRHGQRAALPPFRRSRAPCAVTLSRSAPPNTAEAAAPTDTRDAPAASLLLCAMSARVKAEPVSWSDLDALPGLLSADGRPHTPPGSVTTASASPASAASATAAAAGVPLTSLDRSSSLSTIHSDSSSAAAVAAAAQAAAAAHPASSSSSGLAAPQLPSNAYFTADNDLFYVTLLSMYERGRWVPITQIAVYDPGEPHSARCNRKRGCSKLRLTDCCIAFCCCCVPGFVIPTECHIEFRHASTFPRGIYVSLHDHVIRHFWSVDAFLHTPSPLTPAVPQELQAKYAREYAKFFNW